MIRLGELDRTVRFFRDGSSGRNKLNELTKSSSEIAVAKARRRDLSDRERMQSGRETSALTARFVVLSRPKTRSVKPKDEFSCDGIMWAVVGIKQVSADRNRFLEISAESIGDAPV